MNARSRIVRFPMMLALCALIVACTQPSSDMGGLQDEFEVALCLPRDKAAIGRSTINDDAYVEKVYVKVYNSSNVHLPAVDNTGSEISGVTKLTKSGSTWSATVKLVSPASGTISFELRAVTSWGMTLYAGETSHSVGNNGNSITIPTLAVSAIGSAGPAGGLIFYDQGSYSNGWRYLEAAPVGWSGASADPRPIFGYYRTGPFANSLAVGGTGTAVGAGESNTATLITTMGSEAYTWYENSTRMTSFYAAKVCADFSGGGQEDWFLPSKDELVLMCQNLHQSGLGGFSPFYYWSSSEYDWENAYGKIFIYNGAIGISVKDSDYRIRPARAF